MGNLDQEVVFFECQSCHRPCVAIKAKCPICQSEGRIKKLNETTNDLRAQLAAAEKRATNMAHHTGFLIHALMRIEQGETYRPGLRPEFYGHAMALAKATLAAHKTDATAQAVAEVLEAGLEWLHMEPEKRGPSGANMLLSARLAKLAALDKEPRT